MSKKNILITGGAGFIGSNFVNYKSLENRDKIVKQFFNPKHTRNYMTACFSNTPSKYECNHQMSYKTLIQEQKFQPHLVTDFLLSVLADSYKKDQTRIACEETSWLAEHGMFDDHQKWANSLDEKVIAESAIMCCYNASKMDEHQMKTIIASRKFVILDDPLSVYSIKDS